MEREINEEKLKMLIKFERIKLLEDFYNVSVFHNLLQKYHQDEQICLEIEVSDQEVQDLV